MVRRDAFAAGSLPAMFAKAAVYLAAISAGICGLALVGWAVGSAALTSFIPGHTAMNPATAVGLLAVAASLMLARRSDAATNHSAASRIIAATVTLMGAACLASFVLGRQFPLDQFLFSAELHGNRVAPNTALCLVLLGMSLLTLDRRAGRDLPPSQFLALAAAIVSLLSVVGYTYGTEWLYGVPSFIPMALPTAVAAHLAAWAILFARPSRGVMAVVTSRSLGGIMARRLTPAGFLFPVGLGWLRLLGERSGWYDTSLGVALYAALTSFGLLAVVWWCGRKLNLADDARAAAAENLRRANADLEARVAERTAELSRINRDLQQKNDENEMFVYSVSHDLRSPLVNLQGFSQELKSSCDDVRSLLEPAAHADESARKALAILADDVQPSLSFIQSSVLRLGGIIDALLRLSRAGRVDYRWQVVDVEETVQRIVDALQDSMQKSNAIVSVGQLPPAWGDATAVEQVFANLIGNALNYASADRDPIIEIAAAESDGDSPQITYSVKDNGVGIAQTHRVKVFQAFQRLQPSLAKGEGMGLAMTRRIVERHGGRIWFESVEGIGTEFFFTLPAPSSSVDVGTSHRKEVVHAT